MREFKAEELQKVDNVQIIGDKNAVFIGLSYDSRKVKENNLFVAIKGENVDGNDFVEMAFKAGASCALSSKKLILGNGKALLLSDSPERTIGKFAKNKRDEFGGHVIGVVGSVGKTTTKDFTREFLSINSKAYSNEGNKNNLLGLPETIVNGEYDAKYWVLEMGISKKGEMDSLAEIASPNCVIFTSIKPVHLEFLGNLETIFKEKTKVLNFLRCPHIVIYNSDDKYLQKLKVRKELNLYSFGVNKGADLRFEIKNQSEEGIFAEFYFKGDSIKLKLPFLNTSNIYNFASPFLLSLILKECDIHSGDEVLKRWKPSPHRGIIHKLKDGIILYDDSYNSNPEAVKTLLLSLKKIKRKMVGVLGEMKELGDESLKYHIEIGEFSSSILSSLLCVGSNVAMEMGERFKKSGKNTFYVEKWQDGVEFLKKEMEKGCFVIVKGSRSIGLDKLVDFLIKEMGREKC